MFPCKQRDNTQEYRDNYENIFGKHPRDVEGDKVVEVKNGTERKSRLHTNER